MMKVIATKKLKKEKHRYTFKEILLSIGVALLFLALGTLAFKTPLSYLFFGQEYSGYIIFELILAVILFIIALNKYEGRKVYIIIAFVSFVVGALLVYGLVTIAFPGVDITEAIYS